jgi:hypothetical protein
MTAFRSALGLACLLVLAGAAQASAARALPGFRPLPSGSFELQTYLQARVEALTLVREALPHLPPADARMAARVLAVLPRARFLASSDRDSARTCSSRGYSLFVNAYFRDRIFVCDEVRPHAREGGRDARLRLAQGFVHEAVHLTGELDECVATRFELAVMQRTIGVQSQGSQIRYGAQCRLWR